MWLALAVAVSCASALAIPSLGSPPLGSNPLFCPSCFKQTNTAAWKSDDGAGTHIFLDAAGVDRARTTARLEVHRPTKDPRNPLIRETEKWEDRFHMFSSVVQLSPRELRLYYLIEGRGGAGPAAPATSLFNAVAESTDGGSTWRKPRFGIVRMHNSTANNIVYATPEQHGGAGDHSSDYMAWIGRVGEQWYGTLALPSWFRANLKEKAPWCINAPDAKPWTTGRVGDQTYLLHSEDGFHWTPPQSPNCWLPSKDDSPAVEDDYDDDDIEWSSVCVKSYS